jgi:hypothetical protein
VDFRLGPEDIGETPISGISDFEAAVSGGTPLDPGYDPYSWEGASVPETYVGSADTSGLALPTSDAEKIAIGQTRFEQLKQAARVRDLQREADFEFEESAPIPGGPTGRGPGEDAQPSTTWGAAPYIDMTEDDITYGPNTYAGRMKEFEGSGREEVLWDFQQPGREWPLSLEEADAIGASLPMTMEDVIDISASQSPYSQPYVPFPTSEEEEYVPSLAETDAYGASIEPTMADLIEIFESQSSPAVTTADLRAEFTQAPELPGYQPDPTDVYQTPRAGSVPGLTTDPWYGEGARGTRTDDRLTLVGESGPELALFPNGTEIIPLDRKMKPAQAKRLRRRGEFAKAIDSFQFGGYVGDMGPEVTDLPLGAQTMPAGVSEMLTGRPTRRPRSLFRTAGLRAPSAQTISNLIPSEIEAYRELALTRGGIDQADFEREFRSMVPMGQGGTNQARFTPRRTGRTRYGSI